MRIIVREMIRWEVCREGGYIRIKVAGIYKGDKINTMEGERWGRN